MTYNITPAKIRDKNIDELTLEEMIFVHLSTSYTATGVKNFLLRSTLSFINQNIHHGLSFHYSKQLMPYLSMCSVLDQLGICYNRKDKPEPRFQNGIKRCLYYFGEYDENDGIIKVLYALRNGLLHNVSLSSFDTFNNKYYHFRFDNTIADVYASPETEWNGNYDTLNNQTEKYTTLINTEKFKELVTNCIQNANNLNQNSLLELRLVGGIKQLFFDYIRSVNYG